MDGSIPARTCECRRGQVDRGDVRREGEVAADQPIAALVRRPREQAEVATRDRDQLPDIEMADGSCLNAGGGGALVDDLASRQERTRVRCPHRVRLAGASRRLSLGWPEMHVARSARGTVPRPRCGLGRTGAAGASQRRDNEGRPPSTQARLSLQPDIQAGAVTPALRRIQTRCVTPSSGRSHRLPLLSVNSMRPSRLTLHDPNSAFGV